MLDREHAEPERIGCDRPAGLGLPPMVDHRHAEDPLGPVQGLRVGPFAGQEQGAEPAQIVPREQPALVVGLADRTQRGGRGEQHLDAMLAITRQYAPASGVPTGLPS